MRYEEDAVVVYRFIILIITYYSGDSLSLFRVQAVPNFETEYSPHGHGEAFLSLGFCPDF